MRPSTSSSSSTSASPRFTLSSVTVAVDKATSELLLTSDWTLIIAICDSLNSNRWQCKDAIKAVKRRLQHKSSKVQLLTLSLLEAILKNCGEFVHPHIAEKHVLEDMVKIVKKKGNDYQVRNKILILLDTWNEAFSVVARRYPHYNWAYQELRRSGVKFPQRAKEAPLLLEAPPPRPSLPQSSSSSSMNLMSIGSFRRLDETMATEIESLSLSSLESMRNVMDLVNDMVQAVNPSDKSALKDELIVDLVEQCRSNQKKLIQMLTTTADEDVMARGLELNDSLQVVLARHDAIASGVALPMLQAPETRETSSDLKPEVPATALEFDSSSSSSESETEEGEEVKNDFMQLAKTETLLNAEHSDEEEGTLLLGNNSEKTVETEVKTQCNDLALFDTTTTTTTTTKSEQDIIELLSLTLSTTALPSPQTQQQTQTQTLPPSNSTHHNTSFFADDHILMNSYVVPWAQSQAEPQVPNMAQFAPPGPQFHPWHPQQQQHQQFTYGYPQPQWSGGQANINDTSMWSQGGNDNKVFERNLQYSNSFSARAGGPPGAPAAAAVDGQGQRQYVPPYKLFDDLNVLWNADGGVRSSK
ncbi:hypothetical protein AALP_AA8G010100 [Arabis alpina]|uniref:VHS domain-containing protein n=1 Tax=Arabis alpina TaxID=50452 RepID=A0A087G471_ARAAL|nr:hypothetical protein AALP_AA8G010100 [Arabis alpina]